MTGHRTHSFLCWFKSSAPWHDLQLCHILHLRLFFQLWNVKPNDKIARPRPPILRLMFFLGGGLCFGIGLLVPSHRGGITGLRIKGESVSTKWEKDILSVWSQVQWHKLGFRNTHSRTKIFSVKDTILYWTKRWEIMVFMLLAVSFKGH